MADEQKPWEKYAAQAASEQKPWEKYGGATGQPEPSAPVQPSFGQQFLSFGQEHPYLSAALSMTPGAGALAPGFEQRGTGIVKTAGRDAYDVLTNTIPFARQLLDATGISGRVQKATEPANEGEQAGSYLTRAGEMALPLPKGAGMVREAVPNIEEAGKLFDPIMARVGNEPVDVSRFAKPALRAQEFNANSAATYPPVLKRAMAYLEPTTDPMTFKQARDLMSETGRRAAQASVAPQRLSGTMRGQLSGVAGGLRDATQEIADRAGMGDAYRDALAKYGRAAKIQEIANLAKDIGHSSAVKWAGGLAGGTGLGYALSKFLGGL